jgi:hypothetical protein
MLKDFAYRSSWRRDRPLGFPWPLVGLIVPTLIALAFR